MKKSRYFITALLTALVLTVLLLLIYLNTKNPVSGEYLAVSEDETVSVSLSLERVRHLFRPTQIKGKIIFDGVEYENMSSFGKVYDIYEGNGFFENLKLKAEGFTYDLFVRSDIRGEQMKITKLFEDPVYIGELTSDKLVFYKKDSQGNYAIWSVDLLTESE